MQSQQQKAREETEVPFALTPRTEEEEQEQTDEAESEAVSEEMIATLQQAHEELVRDQKRRHRVGWTMMAALVLPLVFAHFLFTSEQCAIWIGQHTAAFIAWYLGYCSAAAYMSGIFSMRKRRVSTDALAKLRDIRLVGPLTNALAFEDAKTRTMAKQALIELLPQLKSSDAGLLHSGHHVHLNKLLNRPVDNFLWKDISDLCSGKSNLNVQCQIAILKAYEQVGDGQALPIVQKLANRPARTRVQKEVKAAAMACLPFLEARAEAETARQTLLRASSRDVSESENLLRPASGNPVTDPFLLLRSSDKPD